MLKFMDEDFLLQSKTARNLYHNDAKVCRSLIIIVVTRNAEQVQNITELWLGRRSLQMACNPLTVLKKYITGDADDKQSYEMNKDDAISDWKSTISLDPS